jgi:excisionase family DNA binding protein
VKLTLSQFAEQSNIPKPTLHRWIKQGKISGERSEDRTVQIDASELDRVQDIRRSMDRHAKRNASHETGCETVRETMMEREMELLREIIHHQERTIDDLRMERDDWKKQAQTLLLTAGEKKEETPRKRWWRFRK